MRGRRLRRGRGRLERLTRPGTPIRLTSMMDIMTTLLLFLLKAFVVDGEAMVPVPGVELPSSTAPTPPQTSLVVAISGDAILVGETLIASTGDVAKAKPLLIAPLAEHLESAARQMDDIARRNGSAPSDVRTVTIHGDRDIEFRVLEKVMYTVNESGFESVALAVLKTS
jgi:biopolymer transport protein ExbD